MTSSCLACSEGVSEEEYCQKYPTTIGCPTNDSLVEKETDIEVPCAPSMINPTSCKCGTETRVDFNQCERVVCKDDCSCTPSAKPGYCGDGHFCKGTSAGIGAKNGVCTQCPATMINPEACEGGVVTTTDSNGCSKTTCKDNGEEDGAACCMATTASCMACQSGQSVEDYCVEHPLTVGC